MDRIPLSVTNENIIRTFSKGSSMNQSDADRRRSRRTYFTVEDGVFAVIELGEADKMSLSTNLLSLSEGGISFIAQKELNQIQPGERLLLVRVFEPETLSFIHQITIQVRHTISDDEMPHIVCGCQFINLGDDQRKRIQEYVATR